MPQLRCGKAPKPKCKPNPSTPIGMLLKNNINAIKIKIISPAYKFPKSLRPSDIGFAIKLTISKTKFTGIKYLPKGWSVSSAIKALKPLTVML